jgi:O-succinylbenzoic acid--CoA ligase
MVLEEFLREWNNDSPTVLVHTSGSTGKPKPMWVEKQKMLNSARITCDFLGLKPGDSALLCMPLDYIAGKMVVVRAIERKLRLVSIAPCGHPMASVNPTTFAAMVPLQVYNSLQVPEEKQKLMKIRHLIIGGGAIDEEMAAALRSFPNNVWSTYGMTETLSHIALRRLNGSEASEWYTPFDTVEVSQDEDGCLVINAPLVHDGVLKTNDRVEMRKDKLTGKQQFRIIGRKDNVIDSGGIKIQIEEVERLLKPHVNVPFVITKARDRKFGEVVVLLCKKPSDLEASSSSYTIVSEDELRNICTKVLPPYWVPKKYVFVDKLPMTETGKPARAEAEKLVRL